MVVESRRKGALNGWRRSLRCRLVSLLVMMILSLSRLYFDV